MAESLGIVVTTEKHLDHIVGLTKAAKDAGKEVRVFFTSSAVKLCLTEEAQELVKAGADDVALCRVTYEFLELDKQYGTEINGMTLGSQDENAENVDIVDRYVVF